MDYRRYVVSTKDDLLAVLAVMPHVKDVRAMPGLRPALDLWEQLLTDTKIPEWRENLHTFKDAKQPTLNTAHVPVDADVATSLGQIIADMAHLFGAAQRLRTLQARQATAADIDAAEEEVQDKLFAAFMTVANVEQAFPEEQDARAAGDGVAAAVRTVYARPAPRLAP